MEKRRGRPSKSATVVNSEEPKSVLVKYYNMYTDSITCGKPDNLEAVHTISRPTDGRISEVDLLAAGVDIEWLKSIGVLEEYGFLPTF